MGFFLVLFTMLSFQSNAQLTDYQLYPSYCYYQGVNYHLGQEQDWNFYDCNLRYIVTWKYYNEDCELESVTYGPDSPNCLCDGTLQLVVDGYVCLSSCVEINLPPCRKTKGGGVSSLRSEPNNGGSVETLAADCDLPCGTNEGEVCEDIVIEMGNVYQCINGGIGGNFVMGGTGENFDCEDDLIMRWRHWIPNPDYPGNSTSEYTVNAEGFNGNFGSCLCGGRIKVEVKNPCCEKFTYWFNTPACPVDDDMFGVNPPINGSGQHFANIFPNPTTNGYLNLNISESKDIDVQVQLFSQDGKLLKTIQRIVEPMTRIDVANLTPGIYWIKVSGTTNFNEKVIILK